MPTWTPPGQLEPDERELRQQGLPVRLWWCVMPIPKAIRRRLDGAKNRLKPSMPDKRLILTTGRCARLRTVGLAGLFVLAGGGIVVPQARADDRSGLEENRMLTSGIANSLGGAGVGFSHRIGSTGFMAVTTASGTLHGTSIRIGNTTFFNLTTPSGDSIRGTSQRIGNMTHSHTSTTDGDWSSSVTQSIGNVEFTAGSSRRGSFSGTQQRIGATDLTTITTPSGTVSGTSTRVGPNTWHTYSSSADRRNRGER